MTYITNLFTPTPPQPTYKIAILGYEGAGKQSLLRGLTDKGAPIETHRNTACRYPDKVKVHIGHNTRLNVTFVASDIGYSEPPYWKVFRRDFYKDADAAIWVINSRSKDDFYESPVWVAEEMTVKERRRIEEQILKRRRDGEDVCAEEARIAKMTPLMFDEVPWLVLLNQRDCEDRCSLKEVLGAMEPEKLGMKEFRVVEGSVLKWEGIDNGVEWLVERLRKPGKS
ncbi:hypothetical protein N7451_009454 [Penicillium sp. IBT 35674x]|nr:hypothetical protein N7451_009454 [Penicillium sp. IBT 35674x]